jgi:hypothetical protein
VTAPTAPRSRSRFLRPQVALPIIAIVVIIVALLTPEQIAGRSGDARLTSRSTEPQGAAALLELSERLGWRASERTVDSVPLGDTTAVHLVLDPAIPPSGLETHEILDRVRRGAGLLYVVGGGALSDSLGVSLRQNRGSVIGAATQLRIGSSGRLVVAPSDTCDEDDESFVTGGLPFWPDGNTHILALNWQGRVPDGATTLASVELDDKYSLTAPAVIGFPLGRGRVVVAADPDLLRNDVLRVCSWGADVAAVRTLEYLSAGAPGGGRRDRLVFDEYHQGFGDQPGTMRGIVRYLGGTASGHLLLQLAGAGLVLLLAVGPRLLPPRAPERIERRSPLEHVDALARAYRTVGATKTATARLLHGVRRRVEHALGARGGNTTDESFLTWALQRAPERKTDVELVRLALVNTVPRRDLEIVGEALRRLETSLTSFPKKS